MANFGAKHLNNVILSADVYAVCLQHALTTEKEEIMGLLIGEVDDRNVSHITACVILHRSDKQPDRVEISPEQLCTASTAAEQLTNKLKRPMRVLGWYHSHPHITVWPSHVVIVFTLKAIDSSLEVIAILIFKRIHTMLLTSTNR
ncbi:JAB1/Mov34/MPN/PAD-1 ubiquitin protease [Popillia japonica]|uniref:JAB1/Mov34/MPN/PAD-1 ubiquitin protease n=1 Tax=Popillia japonica TaxID=7064 RepID=A0AAW1MDL8_POPJA